MNSLIKSVIIILVVTSCKFESTPNFNKKNAKESLGNKVKAETTKTSLKDSITNIFKNNLNFVANGFDYPVGKPNAIGYYNAQKFGENGHLGDDWNAKTGGNSDLGDPIYSIGNGYVYFTEDLEGGWGNVIRIWHFTKNNKIIESLYAHCDEIKIPNDSFVEKGQLIGTIGNAHGAYIAHLHFEIRDDIKLPVGKGYSIETDGYLDPIEFIEANR